MNHWPDLRILVHWGGGTRVGRPVGRAILELT